MERVSKKRLRVDVLLGVAGRPSIGGATKVTPELGVGNPLNKEPHNGSSAKRMWPMRRHVCAESMRDSWKRRVESRWERGAGKCGAWRKFVAWRASALLPVTLPGARAKPLGGVARLRGCCLGEA